MKGNHDNRIMQGHVNKHGLNDLYCEVLLFCDNEVLIPNEQTFIDSLKPTFNICKKAGNTLGIKLSEETRIKISNASKGRPGTKGKKYPQNWKGKYVTCKCCGKRFYVKASKVKLTSYCSSKCMASMYKSKLTGSNNPNYKGIVHICSECNKEFTSYSKSQKYCSIECRDKARWGSDEDKKARHLEYLKRKRERNAKRKELATCSM